MNIKQAFWGTKFAKAATVGVIIVLALMVYFNWSK